ncbi:TPA: hypothetical protein DDW69_00180 [candidate division CPR2 bacterium]|uniref:Uncharacterized protein n=1 Tax=candidate division CPR2 bacterium GW2011_GWC1_41_48 TaxID=1618344 RepID=A0A0G0YGQ2_UNCC2|nr:MAG: hypothetical protein UT47_C0005G0032 [candidate division CPR2 bacterium GW2011_GWC2_39_35]KKR28484.1 MAG: hypothetical protein UT60_C0019G0019 [candidate division CPR2 bacterium GW2011_GWD2_39_7]KKR29450.1 MAG: hypothetical protein UT59_C0007G0004 [candidate division CPR2 bacterium GW2011_GWD1_39_7]KKS08721.1 MAG: hypothetical protein UU65_C0005G0032 [candidate division CPR2 bacterium GW2011_GWC1_41_48]OGB55609.1 MAG: hypothetical protein A2Y27_03175 [candidate division CPR2 bacterium G
MKKILIEWKHYDKEGETCTRCNNTGENIQLAIKELPKNVKVEYMETKLEAKDMAQSNSIIINGEMIEDILGTEASDNHCGSCSCLSGEDTNCRTIKYKWGFLRINSKRNYSIRFKQNIENGLIKPKYRHWWSMVEQVWNFYKDQFP